MNDHNAYNVLILNGQIKVLECSTNGDDRFSALRAKVKVDGKLDTIENHYQLSKRFNGIAPLNWRDAKGKQPTSFVIGDREIMVTYLTEWYKLLWCKYLDAHPELVLFASDYDDFSDMFRGKNTVNCQADVVRQYVKEGRASLISECSDLIEILKD